MLFNPRARLTGAALAALMLAAPAIAQESTNFVNNFDSISQIRWYIDGKLMHEATETLPVTPQKIFFSHWSTDTLTEWMGPFTTPDQPVTLEVDWVSFTKLGEPCQFAESTLCTASN